MAGRWDRLQPSPAADAPRLQQSAPCVNNVATLPRPAGLTGVPLRSMMLPRDPSQPPPCSCGVPAGVEFGLVAGMDRASRAGMLWRGLPHKSQRRLCTRGFLRLT